MLILTYSNHRIYIFKLLLNKTDKMLAVEHEQLKPLYSCEP